MRLSYSEQSEIEAAFNLVLPVLIDSPFKVKKAVVREIDTKATLLVYLQIVDKKLETDDIVTTVSKLDSALRQLCFTFYLSRGVFLSPKVELVD